MNTSEPVTVYKSNFCPHSLMVERFLKRNQIPATFVNIDGNMEAKRVVMALNNGYASVPTLVFPDGDQLTEPSFTQLRVKLGIQTPSLTARLKALFGR